MDLSPQNHAYNMGRAAYYSGDPCPFERPSFDASEWDEGYSDAHEEEMDYQDNYIGDDYYSGTGELIGDESYIDYLNNY